MQLKPGERGLLLLCSDLGDPSVRPLRPSQYRSLCQNVAEAGMPDIDMNANVSVTDLLQLGCNAHEAQQIVSLLEREQQLDTFLHTLDCRGIHLLTRLSTAYPAQLRRKLGMRAPLLLFGAGELSLLQRPAVSVVGSRDLQPFGREFAMDVGRALAAQDTVLCSGGAVGADEAATQACLSAGGDAVLYLAGELEQECVRRTADIAHLLLLTEGSPNAPFTAQRALARNAYIHAHGDMTMVCQCTHGSGGTWRGTIENLKEGWSPVYVADDGSEGAHALLERGAHQVVR